jgi:hypothetical protein
MPEANSKINIDRVEHKNLRIAKPLADFIQQQVLLETDMSALLSKRLMLYMRFMKRC